MCLAIPGKVVDWVEREPPLMMALVEFGGVRRKISLACVPEADVGDFILAHAGVAISCIDEAAAERVWKILDELEELDEEFSPEQSE